MNASAGICLLRIVHHYQMHKTHMYLYKYISVAVFLICYSHAFNESRRDNLRTILTNDREEDQIFQWDETSFGALNILIEAVEVLMVMLLEKNVQLEWSHFAPKCMHSIDHKNSNCVSNWCYQQWLQNGCINQSLIFRIRKFNFDLFAWICVHFNCCNRQ